MRIALAVLGVLAACQLASCAATMTTAPAKPLPPPLVLVQCPPVKEYTPDQEHALADAVRALPADSPLVRAMVDYGVLRKTARACHG